MIIENENSGLAFKNENATEENNQPDYSGNVNVNGEQMQVALWIKEGKKGKANFLSLLFQEPWVPDNKPKKGGGKLKPRPKPKL